MNPFMWFMAIIKHSSKLEFIIWATNQCETDSEKLKVIYKYSKDKAAALDLAASGSMRMGWHRIHIASTFLSLFAKDSQIWFKWLKHII